MRVLVGIAAPDFVRRLDAVAMRIGDALEKALAAGAAESFKAGISEISKRYGVTDVMHRFNELRPKIQAGEVSEVSGTDENDLKGLERAADEMEAVGKTGLSTGTVLLIIGGVLVLGLGITFLSSMASAAGVGAGTRIVEPRVQVDGRRRKSA